MQQNRVFSVLLGDAVPAKLEGTTDDNYYNHYSEISTVEANWYVPQPSLQTFLTLNRDLYTLGRWDVGANVFANVASHTGDRIRKWSTTPDLAHRYFNSSYPGIFNSETWAPQPVPDCHSRRNGRTTLPSIKATWESQQDKNYYHGQLEVPDGANPPVYPYKY